MPIKDAILYCGNQQALADAIGCTQSNISHILRGDRVISAELALRIHAATAGSVTVWDLRPDLPWQVIGKA